MFKKEVKRPFQDIKGNSLNIRWYTDTNELDIELCDNHYSLKDFVELYCKNEDLLAQTLVFENLPTPIEEILVCKFNDLKRERLAFEDKVKSKKQKILQSYGNK